MCGRSKKTNKELLGCLYAVVGKEIFLVQLGYGQKKLMNSSSLVFLCLKEGFEMDEPLSNLPGGNGEFIIIDGHPEVGEP